MAYNAVPTVATSDSWTASQHNTYIKDNFAAVWVGTTAGDLDYYTSSTAKSRLAIGAAGSLLRSTGSSPAWLGVGALHTFLRSTGSAPEYGSLIYRRQGGNSTIWTSAGTTTYTPTSSLVQTGTASVSVSSGAGSTAITYPQAYSQRPNIFLSLNGISSLSWVWALGWADDTTTGFNLHVKFAGAYNGTVVVSWLAIGA